MQSTYKILQPHDLSESYGKIHSFALDILVGLTDSRKWIPSKYMYDKDGSRLFEEITQLEEYYLTNCELEILKDNKDRISSYVKDTPFNLVELGAGSASKTIVLLEHFHDTRADFRYVPIDISESAMAGSIRHINKLFPNLKTNGLVSDYFAGLNWLNNLSGRKNMVLFLGSSVGNFTHAEARFFLKNVWNSLNHGDNVLIGFDLKKDIETLLWAYNDTKGITAEFNLGLLRRINRELGGEFDTDKFRHFGTYDVFSGAMESYLVSLEEQEVFVREVGRSFKFQAWEPIHTEYSYKYLMSDIENLASDTGFVIEDNIFDDDKWFVDSVWRVEKSHSNRK